MTFSRYSIQFFFFKVHGFNGIFDVLVFFSHSRILILYLLSSNFSSSLKPINFEEETTFLALKNFNINIMCILYTTHCRPYA